MGTIESIKTGEERATLVDKKSLSLCHGKSLISPPVEPIVIPDESIQGWEHDAKGKQEEVHSLTRKSHINEVELKTIK